MNIRNYSLGELENINTSSSEYLNPIQGFITETPIEIFTLN
jgi:hypothetical protein